MAKDLTTSPIDRQNILNNEIAIAAIHEKANVNGVVWNEKIYLSREMAADFFCRRYTHHQPVRRAEC